MAVEANTVDTRMQLKLNTGVDQEGNPVIRTKSYSRVKPAAEDQAIYDVGNSLAGLQDHLLEEVHRVNDVVLINIQE